MSKNVDDDEMDYFSQDDEDESSSSSSDEDDEDDNVKVKPMKRVRTDEDDDDNEDEEEETLIEDDMEYDDDNKSEYLEEGDGEEEETEMHNPAKYGGAKNPSLNALESSFEEEEEEEDGDDDDEFSEEHYLQKFDKDIQQNYIDQYHPECLVHNYEEVSAFTKVVRDVNYNIIDPLHKTNPFLTKYEKARILGMRSKQINAGAKPLVQVPENIIDGYLIAEMELKMKRIPFIIKRPLPGGTCEYWKLSDLEYIDF